MSTNGQTPEEDEEEIPEELVDPDEVVDDQSGLQFAWRNMMGQGAKDPVELPEGWLPNDNDFHSKTILSPNQPKPIAFLGQMEKMFPNIVGDGMYVALQDSLDDYLKSLPSIDGEAREQQVEVLANLPGSGDDTNVNIGSEDSE